MKQNLKKWLMLTLTLLVVTLTQKSLAQAPTYTVSPDAQNWDCGLNQDIMSQLASDTSFVNSFTRYNNSINSGGNQVQSGAPYIVPVVFHIISTTNSTAWATYNQIKWQLAEINAAFNNQLQQFTGKPAGPRNVNTTIEFRLACNAQNCSTPWSNTTEPGVMRYGTSNTLILNQNVLDSATITPMLAMTHSCSTGFSPNNYLNIWCVPNITSSNGITVGYGTFPWMANTAPIAPINGIVMRLDAIGNNTYPTNFPLNSQFDKGAILVHEFGHYLGLFHTFESVNGTNVNTAGGPANCYGQTTTLSGNQDGNMILDTPPTKINADLGSITTINSCNETNFPYGVNANESDQLGNYMSYSDDDKLNTFTQMQANRMIAAFTTIGSPRFNLNHPTNLGATVTGVFPTNSCSNNSSLLTGVFNYSMAPGSSCSSVNIQFTNPTSIGFSATSWAWTFGDGTTGNTASPLHAYAISTPTTFVATCVATNSVLGTTNTFSQTINANFNASIIGQSATTVCRGTEQTIFLNFGAGVSALYLSDGTNTITVNNSMRYDTQHEQPYTFIINSSASYSLFPVACFTNVATFNVVDCCANRITNGDFEAGNTGFFTQLSFSTSATGYSTYLITPLPSIPHSLPSFSPSTGNSMFVGGFAGAVSTFSIPEGCSSTILAPIAWQQTITGLNPNTNYFYSFKVTEGFNNSFFPNMFGCFDINLRTRIYNNPLSPIFQSATLVPTRNIGGWSNPNPYNSNLVYTFTFTTGPGVNSATSYSIEINQINNFHGDFWDFAIDNITLNQMNPSIQAIGSNTICPAQTTTLSAIANCGNSLSNFTYAWTPTVGLSSSITMTTNANPTVTTVYTLVATPTATGTPASISTVTVTVKPTFTITPPSQIMYAGQCATLTVSGSTGIYTWNPGALTGSVVVVCPSTTTVYTITNVASGTCTANNTATVIVSAACTQTPNLSYGTSSTSSVNIPTGNFTTAGTIINLQGTITFTANTSFTGYTLRMAPGTKLIVNKNQVLTLDNCKLFSCTELWYGIELITPDKGGASINVINGTTIEDMYFGIYRNATYTAASLQTGFINILNSKLNKNYIGVQLLNIPDINPAGSTHSLTVKNSTLTTASSTTSPGNGLKPSTIPTYTYAYNKIAGGASGSTTSYTAFPRAHIGINLMSLSPLNNVVIGDSAGVANTTFNTFSNLDIGIVAKNAQLRVHNNTFVNLKGSTKNYNEGDIFNPNPVPIGPDEIGVGVVAQHTIANTYSLQVGTKSLVATMSTGVIYPKSNTFKTVNKGVSAKNCNVVIAKGNWFEADTTDIPVSDYLGTGSPNTYDYYKAQSAVWITGLTKGTTLRFNFIRNYRVGLNVSQTMSVTTGAYVTIRSNNIQSLSSIGYCKQAINLEQVGGANIATDLLDVSLNSINKVYNGIYAKAIAGGLNIYNNASITLDNVKTYSKGFVNLYTHTGIYLQSVSNGKVTSNTNINSITTAPFTAGTSTLTNAVFVTTSASNTITCNSANNVGRAFYFAGNCTSPNGWLGNGISNSYRGLELRSSAVIGTQGTIPSGTLAANTWSNVTQETFVSGTSNANSLSRMYVSPNVGSPKTSPTLNFSVAPSSNYQTGLGFGIDEQNGTPFSCGGGGTFIPMSASAPTSGSTTSITNDALYSSLATNSNTVYPTYADEMMYQSQQLVYALQKQGVVTKNATNPNLQSFYNANITSNIGKFTDVQDAVATNNKTLAQSKNNNISPSNPVQQKTKRANELMLKLNINCNYKFANTELQDLTSMANECEVKGWYVAQARSILNAISGILINYADNCEDIKVTVRMGNEEEKPTSIIEPKRSFTLFPNPNNGSMTMIYDLGKDTKASMNLYDVTGKLINSYDLQNSTGAIEINEGQLHNGIYFYCILVNGIKVNTNKIVIIK